MQPVVFSACDLQTELLHVVQQSSASLLYYENRSDLMRLIQEV